MLVNLIDFAMDADAAVRSPRIHFEDDVVHVEHGFDAAEVDALRSRVTQAEVWPETHMFFGGVHVAMTDAQHTAFAGAGDPRRGGVTVTV